MHWTSTAVVHIDRRWTVEVKSSEGARASLSYSSEAQARYFAAVLELKPPHLPKDAIVRHLAALPDAAAAPVSVSLQRKSTAR